MGTYRIVAMALVLAFIGLTTTGDAGEVNKELEWKVAELSKLISKLETAAALGEDISANDKARLLKSFKMGGTDTRGAYGALRTLTGARGLPGWVQQAKSSDLNRLSPYVFKPQSGKRYIDGTSFDLHHQKLITVLAKGITTLDDAGYDYSWFTPEDLNGKSFHSLTAFSKDFKKLYKQSKMLRKLGKSKKDVNMLLLAVIKIRLIAGYLDSEKMYLEAKKDYFALVETKKTDAASTAQAATLDKKAAGEKIAAQKAREEALRGERLKLERERADTARAKTAAVEAKKSAAAVTALAEKNKKEVDQLRREREKAEVKKAKSDAEQKKAQALVNKAHAEKRKVAKALADAEHEKLVKGAFGKAYRHGFAVGGAIRKRFLGNNVLLKHKQSQASTEGIQLGEKSGYAQGELRRAFGSGYLHALHGWEARF